MVSNLKELLRWLTFIPVPLIFGPIAGALLLIPILIITSSETLIDIPSKVMLTSTMWVVTYWVGAFLKPKKLSMNAFRVIWIVLITLSVSRFLVQNSFYDWRYQLLEIFIPLYFFSYRGDYPDHITFLKSVSLRIKGGLGFIPNEEKLIGYFGWSLPTNFFALCLLLEVIFLTFKGYPFAFLSFIGAVALNTSINTTLYSQDPAFKQNPTSKYLMALAFLVVGIFLVRISGLNSISFLKIPLNLYILPCVLGLTYYPGNYPKDFE
tara:strand:- start:163 stop:957 length:795 start_codon:yes stop_codon:yes gene_type:complete